MQTSYHEVKNLKCYACEHLFTQRLQIGEYPFCPKCGSSDIVETISKAEAVKKLRDEVKKSPYTFREIASQCGKSAGWIGEVFKGNYPYYGANQLPKYLRVWLQDHGFTVAENLITF